MSVEISLKLAIREHTAQLHEPKVSTEQETPKVSVIIPSFNQGYFLEKSILSILNQCWPEIELIVVDGGSTDESVEVIKKYDTHIAWWVSERDNGQAGAINKGLMKSTGLYVTWLGSDDILLPGAVRRMAEALNAHPEAGLVYGEVAFIDSKDNVTKLTSYQDMTLEKLLYRKHSTIAQPSSLLRRATLEQAGGLDESLHYCMDYDLWIRLHKHAPSLNLGKEVLSAYRLHDDSKTVGSYTKMALEKIKVNRRYTKDILNAVIYSHYGYIMEGWLRRIKKGISY